MNENLKGQSAKAASARKMNKEELYQFVLEDYEGKVGFTDYGTKEQMAALYADALLRMERFGKKQNIVLKQSGKEHGGEWSTFEWDNWDNIYIRFQHVPDFNSKSFRELSEEMNDFYRMCFE